MFNTNDISDYEVIWKDHGSGAKRDVSFYANTNIWSSTGMDSRTFTTFSTHSAQSGLRSPYQLKNSAGLHVSVALIVYRVYNTQSERI